MADYFEEMGCRPLEDGEMVDHMAHMMRFLRDGGFIVDYPNGEQRLPPPVSKDTLNNLPDHRIKESGLSCTICLKDFEVGELTKILKCEHFYHKECIQVWLKQTCSCPTCRNEMPTDDEEYENYKKAKKREREREHDIENLHNSMFS